MTSWVHVDPKSDFPIQNLPYGVFSRKFADPCKLKFKKNKKVDFGPRTPKSIGVRIGDFVLDLRRLSILGVFDKKLMKGSKALEQASLNDFMALTPEHWKQVRVRVIKLLSVTNNSLQNNKKLRQHLLIPISVVKMHLPAKIGDYTDFYASYDHAKNVGTMFRGADKAIMPNWRHIPVGYHGRASSVVVSGTPIKRPQGQKLPTPEAEAPVYANCALMDLELEIGAFVGGPGNKLGQPIKIEDAGNNLFGLVLLNDWSARDIQKWEYVPLGPFCGKNFGTTISPWVVTMQALEPFLCGQTYPHDPPALPHLEDPNVGNYDIKLEVGLKTAKSNEYETIATSNMKYLYWTFRQQLVHHSSTGCNMRPGDLLGSGTISGPTEKEYGSMLELCWKGTKPMKLKTGEERKFLADGDSVKLTGFGTGNGFRIGFGECEGLILPANK